MPFIVHLHLGIDKSSITSYEWFLILNIFCNLSKISYETGLYHQFVTVEHAMTVKDNLFITTEFGRIGVINEINIDIKHWI